MMDVPKDDLRSVSDEALYVRLVRLKDGYPRDFDAVDYDRRRDTWEAENSAVTAEIQSRGAQPPAWWDNYLISVGALSLRRHHNRRWFVLVALVYAAICAVAIAVFGGPAVAITFWGTVLVGGPALFIATRIAER
ncbi:hypothetical protein [Micromonospora yangpuensis]|uniref:Uncharacterized protein n=1 Tax=Micromonospora yangpuensis TaxID=683228 RepID=A0A1C6U476_9ACTN|nr:hypothetical protein [Micromonospora yangpuensis]GGL92913.1 hypothetical protein GCM10012279_08210 [Micromonospora yangpuensis]SCL48842.1 hypothetical protein GA0070617_0997 [Micromonospora yangpuensis]